VSDLALLTIRVAVGAIAAVDAAAGLHRARLVRPHGQWALAAVICEAIGGILLLLGLGGPIGPGMVAEALVVIAVVSSAPAGFWDASGRLGYFPALRAMSQLRHTRTGLPIAIAAAVMAVVGSGAFALDRTIGLEVPSSVRTDWFAFLAVSALLVVAVRVLQTR